MTVHFTSEHCRKVAGAVAARHIPNLLPGKPINALDGVYSLSLSARAVICPMTTTHMTHRIVCTTTASPHPKSRAGAGSGQG